MVLRPHGIKSGAKTLAPVSGKKIKQSMSARTRSKKTQCNLRRSTDQPKPSSPTLTAPFSWLARAQALTEMQATPRHLFSVAKVRERIGNDDPMVKLQKMLIDNQSSRCRVALESYCCMVSVKDSEPIFLVVDLIKGLTASISGKRALESS